MSNTHPGVDQHALFEEMGGQREADWRKAFLQFGEDDLQRLKELDEFSKQYVNEVVDDLYKHFLSFEATADFFRDPNVLDHVSKQQKDYFTRLTQGNYDKEYVENRLNIGAVHERINLPPKTYLVAYHFYLRAAALRIMEFYKDDPRRAFLNFLSLMKLVFMDVSFAIDTYVQAREKTIRQSQEAMRFSTPVLPVRDQLLIVPLIGFIDASRALQFTEQLLTAIREYRARAVVIDITGVAAVDSRVANHLLQTVEAARLMGASVVVTGLSPEIAQTLVRIGVDLSRMKTMSDLRSGLEEAEQMLGYSVVPRRDGEAG